MLTNWLLSSVVNMLLRSGLGQWAIDQQNAMEYFGAQAPFSFFFFLGGQAYQTLKRLAVGLGIQRGVTTYYDILMTCGHIRSIVVISFSFIGRFYISSQSRNKTGSVIVIFKRVGLNKVSCVTSKRAESRGHMVDEGLGTWDVPAHISILGPSEALCWRTKGVPNSSEQCNDFS